MDFKLVNCLWRQINNWNLPCKNFPKGQSYFFWFFIRNAIEKAFYPMLHLLWVLKRSNLFLVLCIKSLYKAPAILPKTLPATPLLSVNSGFIHIPSFTEGDVQAMAKIKDSISVGDDPIPDSHLFTAIVLFNLSLSTGIFPNTWITVRLT